MNEQPVKSDDVKQHERLADARQHLRSAKTVPELKLVREGADAVRLQAKTMNLDFDLLNFAAELKLQAERQIGRLLIEMKLRGGDRRSQSPQPPLRLRDLGIDKNQSARWQLEASVPENEFCHFVRTAHAAGKEITSAGLVRLARNRQEAGADASDTTALAGDVGTWESYLPGPPPPPMSKPQREVRELANLVVDAKNHHRLAIHLFESLCERAGVRPEEGLNRALHRYLGENGVPSRINRPGPSTLGRTGSGVCIGLANDFMKSSGQTKDSWIRRRDTMAILPNAHFARLGPISLRPPSMSAQPMSPLDQRETGNCQHHFAFWLAHSWRSDE